jgi:hypothetical protein
MTEQQQQEAQRSYERLKNDTELVPRPVREQWIKADATAEGLIQSYEGILRNDELTDEAKQKRAQTLYQEKAPRVAAMRKEARDALLKAAESAERSSIPFVGGEGLTSSDTNALLASQGEADRIRRILERRSDKSIFSNHSDSDFLTSEYKRGLKLGGVEGSAILRGCLRAAAELGLGDEWLPREERHHAALDKARRLLYAADGIDTNPPRPPKSLRRSGAGRLRSERGPANVLVGVESELGSTKRSKHWG